MSEYINKPKYTMAQMRELLEEAEPEERERLNRLIDEFVAEEAPIFVPQPGPQLSAYEHPADVVGFGGAGGAGKEQPLDAKVLTPKGWRRIGDLKVGDAVTDPTTGGHSRVISIHPQGVKDIYRVTMDDGGSTEVGLEHIWAFKRPDRRRPWSKPSSERDKALAIFGGEPRVVDRWTQLKLGTTAELMSSLAEGARPRIPLTEPVIFTVNGRTGTGEIPPYFIGLYLGDGCHNLTVTSCDREIQDYLVECGLSVRSEFHTDGSVKTYGIVGKLRNAFKYWLSDHGLSSKRAWEKFIPNYVLTASLEYRLAVLQGLMDSDGYVSEDGRCEFTSTSEELARGVQELVRSLGGKAWWKEKSPLYSYKGEKKEGRLAYTVTVQLSRTSMLFRLSRKKARCTDSWNGGYENMRAVASIEKTRRVEAVCIKVSSPFGLYVTDDYIVTHNTGLICGLALTQHTKTLIMRDEGTQLQGLKDDLVRMVGHREGFNEQRGIWREPLPGKQIEFGSMPNPGDEEKFRGRDHDLLCLDEVTEMREDQVRFIQAWVRTTIPGQRCRIVMTFNPPRKREGMWVIKYFKPWLDTSHPNPAMPGEIRWFATVAGEDYEVPDNRPFVLLDGEITYEFDPKEYDPVEVITPESRTFIPSRLKDNVFLDERYMRKLQALPEPLRSQMLEGKFVNTLEDDAMQVIPTAWVEAAQARWQPVIGPLPPMDTMGVDIARGGKDFTEIARRHGWWFDEPIYHPGKDTPDGMTAATHVIHARRDDCPVAIDAIGVGSSPTDFLNGWGVHVVPIIANQTAGHTDKTGMMTFSNQRSYMWWRMRELLDPANGYNAALPRDKQLLEDLTAPTYTLRGMKIYVLNRDEIFKVLKRSPDRGTAYVQAALDIPRRKQITKRSSQREEETYWELA